MKKKILHILCHTLDKSWNLNYHVFGNWCARQAKNIAQTTDEFANEVWYPVVGFDKGKVIVRDNVTYRLFPAKTLNRLLESFWGIIDCPSLFETLESENPQNLLIHFQGERGGLLHKILKDYPEYKIVLQYHGYGQPPWLDWLEKLILAPIERKNFRRISHFFVPIKPRIRYLIETLNIDKNKISLENNGIAYNFFKPFDKTAVRKKLGLPRNVFIILYIGAMLKSKGADKIIKAYRNLKKKHSHLFLMFVGASKTDPLYKDAIQSADKIEGIKENTQIPQYFAAADVYCYYGNPKTKRYAGPGVTTTEALACNLNVISTNLHHFPDKIVPKIGFIPKNFDDFVQKIDFLIQHPEFKFNPRKIIEPYVSYEIITKKFIRIYEEILK